MYSDAGIEYSSAVTRNQLRHALAQGEYLDIYQEVMSTYQAIRAGVNVTLDDDTLTKLSDVIQQLPGTVPTEVIRAAAELCCRGMSVDAFRNLVDSLAYAPVPSGKNLKLGSSWGSRSKDAMWCWDTKQFEFTYSLFEILRVELWGSSARADLFARMKKWVFKCSSAIPVFQSENVLVQLT